jgi:hypothetical protein
MFKKCVYCGKEFECFNKPRKGGKRGKVKRRSNSKTCSPKCAKAYSYSRKCK